MSDKLISQIVDGARPNGPGVLDNTTAGGIYEIYSGPRPLSANSPPSGKPLLRGIVDALASSAVLADDKFMGMFGASEHVNLTSYATTILDPHQPVMDASFKDTILNHGKNFRVSFYGHETVDLDVTIRLKIRAPRDMYDHWTAVSRLKA